MNATLVRFWARVSKDGPVHPVYGQCWTFNGKINEWGYGVLKCVGSNWLAHRYSWFIHTGRIAGESLVLHKCDNPSCVNPDHLFLGTHADNADDKMRKGRGESCSQKGEMNPSAILSEDQVKWVRSNYVRGSRTRGTYALSRMFRVGRTTISNVINGISWNQST